MLCLSLLINRGRERCSMYPIIRGIVGTFEMIDGVSLQ